MLLVQLKTDYYRLYHIKIARPDYVISHFSYENSITSSNKNIW